VESLEAATAPLSQDCSLDSPILGLSSAAAAAAPHSGPAVAEPEETPVAAASAGSSHGTTWLQRMLSRRSSRQPAVAAAAVAATTATPTEMLPLAEAGPSIPVLLAAAEVASTPPTSERRHSRRTWRRVGEGYSPVELEDIASELESDEEDDIGSPPATARRLFEAADSGAVDNVDELIDPDAGRVKTGKEPPTIEAEIADIVQHLVDVVCDGNVPLHSPIRRRQLLNTVVVSVQLGLTALLVILPAVLMTWCVFDG
jgi:hypothetical protein